MKKYLVQTKTHDGEYVDLKNEKEIIEMINFLDCNNEVYKVYDVTNFAEVKELKIYGPWHNPDKPLYIKLTDENHNIVLDGYGVEH